MTTGADLVALAGAVVAILTAPGEWDAGTIEAVAVCFERAGLIEPCPVCGFCRAVGLECAECARPSDAAWDHLPAAERDRLIPGSRDDT